MKIATGLTIMFAINTFPKIIVTRTGKFQKAENPESMRFQKVKYLYKLQLRVALFSLKFGKLVQCNLFTSSASENPCANKI